MASLADEMRNFIVASGLGKKPSGSGSLPTIFVEPKAGAPAPDDLRKDGIAGTIAVTLTNTGAFATVPHEAFLDERTIDVIIRADNAKEADEWSTRLAALLDDKRNYNLGAIRVSRSLRFRGFQRLPTDPSLVEQGYIFTMSFVFIIRKTSYNLT